MSIFRAQISLRETTQELNNIWQYMKSETPAKSHARSYLSDKIIGIIMLVKTEIGKSPYLGSNGNFPNYSVNSYNHDCVGTSPGLRVDNVIMQYY